MVTQSTRPLMIPIQFVLGCIDKIQGAELVACVFDIVAGVVLAITSLLLAYSACNNKHRSLVMTWLIADMIITCVNLCFLFATFFVAVEPTRFNYVLAIIFDIGKLKLFLS